MAGIGLLPMIHGRVYNYLAGEFIEGLGGAASHFWIVDGTDR